MVKIYLKLFLILSSSLLFSACKPPATVTAPVSNRPNVLIVTIDTLRYDRTGINNPQSKTPYLDKYFSQGVVFEQAYTLVPLTLPAHASMMTGLHPVQLGVHNNGPKPMPLAAITLAEKFKTNGYQTLAAVSASVLAPATHINQGFDHYNAKFKKGLSLLSQRTADKTVPIALDLLAKASKEKPVFMWLHLYDPHDPFTPPAGFALSNECPYDAEVRYADLWTGKFLDKWQEFCGTTSNIVIVLADHGEGLGDHGEDFHGLFLFDSTLHVPLAIKASGVDALVVTQKVCHYDIFPTILNYCGIDYLYDGAGLDLLNLGSRQVPIVSETVYPESLGIRVSRGYSIKKNQDRLILQPKINFYANDQLVEANPKAHYMSENMQTTLEALRANQLENNELMDAKALAAITSLGYVGSISSEIAATGPLFPHPDWVSPMVVTGYISRFEKVRRISLVSERLKLLQELYLMDPQAQYIKGHLGLCYVRMGNLKQALFYFDKVSITNYCNMPVIPTMAMTYIKTKQYQRALECGQAAVELLPSSVLSYNALAAAQAALGQFDSANKSIIKAKDLDQNNYSVWNTAGYIAFKQGHIAQAKADFLQAINCSATNDIESLNNYSQVCHKLADKPAWQWAQQMINTIKSH